MKTIGLVFFVLFSMVSVGYSACGGDFDCDGDVDGSDPDTFSTVNFVTYSYFDDFSTNKAEMDSYEHSPFVDTLPDIFLSGLLKYEQYWFDRVLGFHSGFMAGADAYLNYRFHVGNSEEMIISGRIELDVFSDLFPGHINIFISDNGVTWTLVGSITQSGHYSYLVSLAGSTLYLSLSGGGVSIDNLYIELETQPVCEGDFEPDGDVDGSDLAVFAVDFGRTDCSGDCEGDFDNDFDVDGSDLAVFAADFGRTDCPTSE